MSLPGALALAARLLPVVVAVVPGAGCQAPPALLALVVRATTTGPAPR